MAVEWLTSGFTGTTTSYSGSENSDGGSGLTLGTVVSPVKAGNLTHIRFWKVSVDSATSRTVGIYSAAGTLLYSQTTSGEPVGTAQWIDVTLTTPFPVTTAPALTNEYVIAVSFAQQKYPATNGCFTGSASNPNGQSKYSTPAAALYSPGDSEGNQLAIVGNGLFNYGTGLNFPNGSFSSGFYWVDVGWEAASSGGVTVNLTGTSGTGAVGNPSISGKANVSPTGSAGTGAVGTVVYKGSVGPVPTGQSATGSVGNVTVTGKSSVVPTGVLGTLAQGTAVANVSGGVNVSPTGNAATGSVGNPTIVTAVNVSVTLTGTSGTGATGTLVFRGNVSPAVTGVAATGATGTVSVTVQAAAINNVTGVEGDGFVGDVTITSVNNIPAFPTGVEGVTSIGSVAAGPIIPVTIFFRGWGASSWGDQSWNNIKFQLGQMNASVGNVLVANSSAFAVTGVSASTAVGNVSILAGTTTVFFPVGMEAVGEVGDVLVTSSNRITVTGIAQPCVVGNVNILLSQNVSVTGMELQGLTNLVTTINDTNLEVSGIEAICAVGDPFIQTWNVIPEVDGNWTPVSPGSVNTWNTTDVPSNNWTPVR